MAVHETAALALQHMHARAHMHTLRELLSPGALEGHAAALAQAVEARLPQELPCGQQARACVYVWVGGGYKTCGGQ
jgi:hypothetical protein